MGVGLPWGLTYDNMFVAGAPVPVCNAAAAACGTPTLVRSLAGTVVERVAAGYFSSGCIDSQRRAYTWGHGLNHQLGHGKGGAHEWLPRMVEPLRNVTQLAMVRNCRISIL